MGPTAFHDENEDRPLSGMIFGTLMRDGAKPTITWVSPNQTSIMEILQILHDSTRHNVNCGRDRSPDEL